MRLFHAIMRRLKPESSLSELAEKIADRSFDRVWRRVSSQILALTPAEARGYIRARGAIVLQPRFEQIAAQYEVIASHRPRLYSLATETLIQRVQVHAHTMTGQRVDRRAA